MNCDNLNCPARCEPLIPCWEIAWRAQAFHSVSNTCRDCAVFILNKEVSAVSLKKLQHMIMQRVTFQSPDKGHQVCF